MRIIGFSISSLVIINKESREDMVKAVWKKIIKYVYDKCLEIVLDDDYERDYNRNYSKYLRYYRKRTF